MARDSRADSPRAIGERLRLVRIAYGTLQGHEKEMKQAEIARLCGVSPQAWNNAETGDNRIGVDNAMAIWLRTGADLNYIYGGEPAGLHHALAKEIERLESAVPTAKRA